MYGFIFEPKPQTTSKNFVPQKKFRLFLRLAFSNSSPFTCEIQMALIKAAKKGSLEEVDKIVSKNPNLIDTENDNVNQIPFIHIIVMIGTYSDWFNCIDIFLLLWSLFDCEVSDR